MLILGLLGGTLHPPDKARLLHRVLSDIPLVRSTIPVTQARLGATLVYRSLLCLCAWKAVCVDLEDLEVFTVPRPKTTSKLRLSTSVEFDRHR